MIGASLIFLAVLAGGTVSDKPCDEEKTQRQVRVCESLEKIEDLEIRSVESVAVGSHDEMLAIRPRARECLLINRIDYVGESASVFDIINADPAARLCLVEWLEAFQPELLFSEEKLERLVTGQ